MRKNIKLLTEKSSRRLESSDVVMGFFSKLKNTIKKIEQISSSSLSDINTNEKTFDRDTYNQEVQKTIQQNEKIIEDFCRTFDLNSASGIQSITLADYKKWSNKAAGVPSMPEQILRKKATEYKKSGNWDLAIECLKKSNEFSPYSSCSYSKHHYVKLVDCLFSARRFDEARSEQAKIDEMFCDIERTLGDPKMMIKTPILKEDEAAKSDSFNSLSVVLFQMSLESAKQLETDLVEMSEHSCVCGECAKYQGRVFSISGKSKKFPKLPEEFWKYGGVHEGCGHTIHPYIDGVNSPLYHQDIVTYSNRPFIDNRTEEQKAQYEAEAQKAKELAEERARNSKELKEDKSNYYWCYEYLEDLCPKSFSGYRRMKKGNTANFQKLAKAAEEKGRKIN